MTRSAGTTTTSHEELAAAGTGETAGAKAAIVIASREPGVLQILQQELTKRYAADYQIVVCGQPTKLASWMQETLAADLVQLARDWDQNRRGSIAIPATYLETVLTLH